MFKAVLGSLLISNANAANWALLATGSHTYNNYRHQADMCHAYQALVSKGFSKDRIVTMAYDDIAHNEANPFPGQIFNVPSAKRPGLDVYKGCNIDYKGKDVTADNFRSLLLGNGTTGGNGRTLNTGPDDHLTVLYFDHGAPGLIQFPAGDVVHADEFQKLLKTMHNQKRFGKMVIYFEACNSGSMLDGFPTDMNIYGVTAVGASNPSLGTYCGYDAVIDNTQIGSCLGDLFSAYWIRFVTKGDGSSTLNEFFESVADDVSNVAASHWGVEQNQQYGDLSMGDLKVADFFHGDLKSFSGPGDLKSAPLTAHWVAPTQAFAAPRLAVDRHHFEYTEASAQPTYHGVEHWLRMVNATHNLQKLLDEQKQTQQLHWDLVNHAIPKNLTKRLQIWSAAERPLNANCELQVHHALAEFCDSSVDVSTSYALQFHQVVVNLCADADLNWGAIPERGVAAAMQACRKAGGQEDVMV